MNTSDGLAVEVVSTGVFFDEIAGRWFGDFDLTGVAGTSYAPMLRPVLARYQPHSVPGLELSPVVIGDFVPVLPDRILTVTTDAGGDLLVTLDGLGPSGPFTTAVEVVVERGPVDTDLSLVGGTGLGLGRRGGGGGRPARRTTDGPAGPPRHGRTGPPSDPGPGGRGRPRPGRDLELSGPPTR